MGAAEIYVITAIAVVITGLAVMRVTMLITQDTFFDEPREWLEAKLTFDGMSDNMLPYWRRKLAYLITCPYCASAYVAALAVWMLWGLGGMFPVPPGNWMHWPALWLAVWAAHLIAWAASEGHEK